jgi:hypothetical protein
MKLNNREIHVVDVALDVLLQNHMYDHGEGYDGITEAEVRDLIVRVFREKKVNA